MVPAVTEVWYPQPAHTRKTPRPGHDLLPPHRGQQKPSGQRSLKRYSRHPPHWRTERRTPSDSADSLPLPDTTHCAYRSQAHTQLLVYRSYVITTVREWKTI